MTDFKNTLDPYFEERTANTEFSGVVRITRGTEEIYAGAFGYASQNWKIPNALDIRFDTASITKLFTSVAVLQQIDQGAFNLQTGVIDYLGIKDTTISKDVTVYHLLTHTSGIGDDAEEENGENYEDLWVAKPNYSIKNTADFLPQFIHKPANFAPGEGCRYCNCSFILLGLMVEKATGMTYRDYVREHVFAKAKMHDTDFLHMAQANEKVAEGLDPIRDEDGKLTGWKKNIYSYPPIGSPDAGAYVTAADLDRFLRAVKAGQLLSPTLTKAFFTPQADYRQNEGWKQRYGFGIWFFEEDDGNIVCYQKEGINAGVSGMIRHFPAQDVSVVILSNMENGVWAPIWKIHELIASKS